MKLLKIIIITLIFLFAVIFALQNQEPTTIYYDMFGEPIKDVPLFIVIFFSLFLGILIGGLSEIYERIKLKSTVKRQRNMIEELERELNTLRNLPLTQSEMEGKDTL